LFLSLALACACWVAASAGAASTGTAVTMQVPSATSINAIGCATGVGATTFGAVQPGTPAVTSTTCDVQFGSSNDSSMLRVSQSDAVGAAMYRLTDGAADTGFSGDGISPTAGIVNVRDAAVDSAGRLYVAGTRNSNIAVARYTTAGTLDPTWGSAGVGEISMPLLGGVNCVDESRGIAIDSVGRVVVVGHSVYGEANPSPVCSLTPGVLQQYATIARFSASGLPDTSFSGDGILGEIGLVPGVGSNWGQSFADVAIAGDGTILVAGGSRATLFSGESGLLGRYSGSNGALLSLVEVNQYPAPWDDAFNGITLQPDGQLVATGWYYRNDLLTTYATMYRASPTTLAGDATFGVGGQQLIGTSVGRGVDVMALPSGSLLALTDTRRVIQRLAGGGADNSFDTDGLQTVSGTGASMAMLRHPDGSILVTSDTTESGGDSDWHLSRVLANGAIDTRFSVDGRQIYEPTVGTDRLEALVDAGDGAVYAVGRHDTSGGILRLQGLTLMDYASPTTDWDGGASAFGACLESVTNAAAVWSATGSCTATDADPWNAIPTSVGGGGAKVASAATSVTNGVARLRFGIRPATSQPPGTYLAPITFTVVAPDA
jgi:uncharacterized delta-60 repeat protein